MNKGQLRRRPKTINAMTAITITIDVINRYMSQAPFPHASHV